MLSQKYFCRIKILKNYYPNKIFIISYLNRKCCSVIQFFVQTSNQRTVNTKKNVWLNKIFFLNTANTNKILLRQQCIYFWVPIHEQIFFRRAQRISLSLIKIYRKIRYFNLKGRYTESKIFHFSFFILQIHKSCIGINSIIIYLYSIF